MGLSDHEWQMTILELNDITQQNFVQIVFQNENESTDVKFNTISSLLPLIDNNWDNNTGYLK